MDKICEPLIGYSHLVFSRFEFPVARTIAMDTDASHVLFTAEFVFAFLEVSSSTLKTKPFCNGLPTNARAFREVDME